MMETTQILERATAHHLAGEFGHARALYDAALAIAPDDANVMFRLGVLDMQSGAYDAALAWLDRALTRAPDNARYHFVRGQVFAAAQRFAEAIDAYLQALSFDANSTDTLFALAAALQSAGEDAAAIADFAADVRAPTPTGAAELVSPQRVLLLRELDHRHATLARGFGRMMERRAQQLDWLARRLVSPAERLARQRTHLQQLSVRLASAGARPVRDARARFSLLQMRWQRWRPDLAAHQAKLGSLSQRLDAALLRQHERQAARIDTLAARLEVLSPKRTLERGYAAVLDAQSGRAVRAPSSLKPGRRLTVHLAEGAADIALADVQPRLTDAF